MINPVLKRYVDKTETTIKLKKQARKILCFSAAYNGTFVSVNVIQPGADESLVHYSADGDILYEHRYPDIINFFGMMNQKQCIVFDVPNNRIDIHNLETKSFFSVSHQYLFDDVAQMEIHCFSETQTFCVQEKGTFHDHRLRLTYYSYEEINHESIPIETWSSKKDQWTYDMPLRKGNNHSKIIWWKQRQVHDVEFYYFDLVDKFATLKTKCTLGEAYQMDDFQMQVGSIWEGVKDVYHMFTVSNKIEKGQQTKNPNGVWNNNYVFDNRVKQDPIVRQAKYDFGVDKTDPADQFSWNEQLVYAWGVGNTSVYHTFKHKGKECLASPIYYIDNRTEEIFEIEYWKASCFYSWIFPGWDGDTIVVAHHENGEVQQVRCQVKRIWNHLDVKFASMYLLLNLNNNFDDDLLMQAIDLLD